MGNRFDHIKKKGGYAIKRYKALIRKNKLYPLSDLEDTNVQKKN